MVSNRLYRVLLEHSNIEPARLDDLMTQLKDKSGARALGALVVQKGFLSFSAIMELALLHDLIPKSRRLVERLEKYRSKHRIIKPQHHKTRYKLDQDETVSEQIELDKNLTVPIPRPDLTRYHAISTDERQVVEMAVELVNIGQYQEAEMFLIDARDEFPESARVPVVLIWLYLLCHRFEDASQVCATAMSVNRHDINLMEFTALTEQTLGKHLRAINCYQQLTLLPRVKPVWYLLLAISLERVRLTMDASLNYRIYVSLGPADQLRTFATQRLNHLAA